MWAGIEKNFDGMCSIELQVTFTWIIELSLTPFLEKKTLFYRHFLSLLGSFVVVK